MTLKLNNITKESFAPFGTVFGHHEKDPKADVMVYEPVVTEESNGWIWAILSMTTQQLNNIHCHPTSKESFEPHTGTTVLVVAEPDKPEEMTAFLLDKPVMLEKGVWHNTLALSEESSVKIIENTDPTMEKIELDKPLQVILSD